MGGSMNPWHRTTGKCPCGKDGHMPEEAGEYWAVWPADMLHHPEITLYAPNRKLWIHNMHIDSVPLFWRIPDGHPPIPEE
jgi:hypothetical protein